MAVVGAPMVCGSCEAENEPGARYCSACGWSREHGLPTMQRPARQLSAAKVVRAIAGGLAFFALAWIFSTTMESVTAATRTNASAVQLMQVNVEGAFVAIIVIGLAISTYIATR